MIRLQYLKWDTLWTSVLGDKYKKYLIENPLFDPEQPNNKVRLSEICDGKVLGFSIHHSFNMFNPYILEYGEWDVINYFTDWCRFFSLTQINCERVCDILYRAITAYTKKNNLKASDVLEQLWDEMWIFDRYTYAYIKYRLVWEKESSSERNIYDIFDDINNKINISKNVKDLNEWLIYLHSLLPEVNYANVITFQDEDDEVRSYNRFFEEIKADIVAVFINFAFSAIHNMPELISILIKNRIKNSVSNSEDIQKSIQYESRSRVVMPSYWFDEANEWLMSNDDENSQSVPSPLNIFDNRMAVGFLCHSALLTKDSWLYYLLTGEMRKKDRKEILLRK